ncbi:MAG: hypothetical protein JWN32_3492 [Solirubrobacterales bacterium]|nr:hypothetical protein [Solirubrobacterales bacterium]
MSRQKRTQRAFTLFVITGGGTIATLVFAVLWIAGTASFGVVLLLAVITAIAGYLLNRTLGR